MSDLNLCEFPCPDCAAHRPSPGSIADTIAEIGQWFAGGPPPCGTCGGAGRVLVKREDLIKLSKVGAR